MINKIRDMDGSDKAKLAVIIVLLVITVVIAIIPLLHSKKEMTVSELRTELNDTAWERKTKEGTEGRFFSQCGEMCICTLKDNGKVSKDSCWMQYEITEPGNIFLTNHDGDTLPSHTKNKGDHKISVDGDTLEIDGVKYHKADFEKWKNISYDYERYWQ